MTKVELIMKATFIEQGRRFFYDEIDHEDKSIMLYAVHLDLDGRHVLLMPSYEHYQIAPTGVTCENLDEAKEIIADSTPENVLHNLSRELMTTFGVLENGKIRTIIGTEHDIKQLLEKGRWTAPITIKPAFLNPFNNFEVNLNNGCLSALPF